MTLAFIITFVLGVFVGAFLMFVFVALLSANKEP